MTKKYYNLNQKYKAEKDFKNTFGVVLNPFIDNVLTSYNRKITINTVSFDEYLYQTYSHYLNGVTMREFIEMEFGKKGIDVFSRFTPATSEL